MSEFRYRLGCTCGWHTSAHGSSIFLTMGNECCPRCGAPSRGWTKWKSFIVVAVRWVSESTWWKPWTWGAGHWETRDGEDFEAMLAKRTEGQS